MSIISVTNSKGGVGKTTLVANLAGFLADLGKRVLIVDTDIQPTLSSYHPLSRQSGERPLAVKMGTSSKHSAPSWNIREGLEYPWN